MNFKCLVVLASLFVGTSHLLIAQEQKGSLTGDFQTDFQYYLKDSVSTKFYTEPPPQKMGSNTYFRMLYQSGNLKVGARYESYLPAMLGYPVVFNSQGIVNRFASYQINDLEVTAGNFYEQFGSGMILRAQEQRQLGLDNAFDGFRLKYFWADKAKITALMGKQRDGFEKSQGDVKGVDAEWYINRILNWKSSMEFTVGGSYVSRFQEFDPNSPIPQTVNAFSGRIALAAGNFNFTTEYVHKTADPSPTNGGFVEPNLSMGEGLLLNASYTIKGLSVILGAKRISNMDFRSDRRATANHLQINFVPTNTTQHTYRLLTIYPYATQLLGEYAVQGDVIYKIPKNTFIGGKNGLLLTFNYALARNLENLSSWKIGKKTYFQDINIELSKKWSKSFQTTVKYVYLEYDATQIEGRPIGDVITHTIIVDNLYKINTKNSLRLELQHLSANNDRGNWAFALLEYAKSPSWSVFISNELNYGKIDKDVPINYYNGGFAYVRGANRFSFSYGRQRYGLICVGGICRLVPAYSGFSASVTSRF
jgi:hypothetical protein